MSLKKKDRAGVVRRYTFKLYPTKAQADRLHEMRRLCGELWNALLVQREMAYRAYDFHRAGKPLSFFDQAKEITALRAAMPEYAAMSSVTAKSVAKRLDLAFQAFFARVKRGDAGGYPSSLKSGAAQSIANGAIGDGWNFHPAGGTTISCHNGGDYSKWHTSASWRLYIKGVEGLIKARGEFPAPVLKALDSVVIWNARTWWLSIAIEVAPRMTKGNNTETIKLNLIDKFCDGLSEAGAFCSSEAQISTTSQGVIDGSPSACPETGADRRHDWGRDTLAGPSACPETGADRRDVGEDRSQPLPSACQETGADRRRMMRALRPSAPSACQETGADRRSAVHVGREHAPSACPEEGGQRSRQAGEMDIASIKTGRADKLKSERDTRFKRGSWNWREYSRRIAKVSAHEKRAVREFAHRWTTAIIRRAADITVIMPAIKSVTKSAKGSARDHGAAVATVAKVNRHILAQIPSTVEAMLAYKAAEAGAAFRSITDEAPIAAIGQEISKAAKAQKQARRAASGKAKK